MKNNKLILKKLIDKTTKEKCYALYENTRMAEIIGELKAKEEYNRKLKLAIILSVIVGIILGILCPFA